MHAEPTSLRLDVEDLPDACVVADAEGRVRAVNGLAARLLRVGRTDLLDKHLRDALPFADDDGAAWGDPLALADGAVPAEERLLRLPDGSELVAAARIVRAEGPDARVARLVVRLREVQPQAAGRGDLLAAAAHELRGPLAGIRGFTTALLASWDRLDDAQRRLLVQSASADAQRLGRMVTQLLDAARIEAGAMPPRRERVELVRHVRHCLHRAEASGVDAHRLVLEVLGRPPTVLADPDQVDQVLSNLVDNALRHGAGRVSVTVAASADGVRLEVADEGPGIPMQRAAHSTERYWRSGPAAGSGLGLFLVRGMVAAHGGTVEVGRGPRGGALVAVTFPTEERTAARAVPAPS